MGTRSTIALEFADGTVEQVYCHWDGYLEYNGKILLKHYSDPFILRDLIDLGDVSALKPEIGFTHPFSPQDSEYTFDEWQELFGEMTTFYGRDRGETGTQSKKFANFAEYVRNHQYEEYEYILRNVDGQAVWFVSHPDVRGYVRLDECLAKNVA